MSSNEQTPQADLAPHGLRGERLRWTLRWVTIAWFFGAVWMSAIAGTPQTNYLKALGATPFQFGVLVAIPYMASFLTVPATLFIEATGRRKLTFLVGLYFQRLMWVPLALVPMWIFHRQGGEAAGGSSMAVLAFLGMIFLMYAGNAVGNPAWMGWMSDIVPPGIRGTYFSRRRQWGLVSAIPAAWGAGWILDYYAQTHSATTIMATCAVVYVIACMFGVTDIAIFQWIPDVPTEPKKGSDLIKSWGEPLRNRNFLHFGGFVGTMVFAVAPMGQFLNLYILHQLGADSTDGKMRGLNQITQLMLLVAPSIAQLLVLHVWGKAADRMGKRPVLILAALGLVPVGLGWCFVNVDRIWLGFLLSALGGALWAGIDVVNFNIVLEFSGSAKKDGTRGGTAYVAVNAMIINIAGCIGGLAFGYIAQRFSDMHWALPWIGDFSFYHILFILSGVLRLVAVVVFLPHLHEPEARPTVEALRYMSSNIYNNLFSAIMQPLRLVGLQNDEKESTQ